ncbi:SDR family NAD(P)-dependent oxidoreductase [Chromobacterium piscinae]|uniref:SDR family NAD(P)-dependent oxidoreductase n=1 Tax=Chromobacterium piscinae TaxID=686831 RepID=UPI001E2A3334|nr:SDR family NAD(P)-dependent oxidoreductase [Chromobacterium piscinae]MCD5326707.1 SDR family NAD(P)-dependent oxidoreductase [Chromobacterium piscinae]
MLSVINRYSHGFVAIPIVLACKYLKLFEVFKGRALTLTELADELKANSGFLLAALRLLESLQWISKDNTDRYSLTAQGLRDHEKIPETITSLLDFPVDRYLEDPNSHLSLKEWIDCSVQGWGVDSILLQYLLDGMLMTPLLLGLRQSNFYVVDERAISFAKLAPVAKEEILRLFQHNEWCSESVNSIELNDVGKFMMERIMNTGTVVSYTPMLKKIGQLIGGNPAELFVTDKDGHETHVERTLNVVSSGFQHDRYFRAMEEIFASIFNELPVENQPNYIADVGCGDGTLLRRVYNIILKTERGRVLHKHPLTLIGVDYNHKALEATNSTLNDINHLVLHGDIGNPKQIEIDLEQHIEDVEKVLYVRSFLDHDRPFIEPDSIDQIQQRSHVKYDCISVDKLGSLIPPALAVQSLVDHLIKWSSIRSKYGIIILEVHSLSAGTVAQYVNESENLHFDAYHAFSKQHLVDAPTFLAAAAEAGLVFEEQSSKKYPAIFPYARITLNHFRLKEYQIRVASYRDIEDLVNLEKDLPAPLRSSSIDIEQRISDYPEGQMLLVADQKLVGVIYSRRTTQDRVGAFHCSRQWEHHKDGSVVELLYVIAPDPKLKNELLIFMKGYSRVMNCIDQVVGENDCMNFGCDANNLDWFDDVIAPIKKFVDCYDIKPEQDTLVAETILEDFGVRWLLSIFQSMGVLRERFEIYSSVDSIAAQLGILPKYKSLFSSLIGIFERKGLLDRQAEGLSTTEKIENFGLADIQCEYTAFKHIFQKEHPESVPFMNLMATCLGSYGEVLTGVKEATDIVFPQGSVELFAGIFKDSSVADYFNRLTAEIVHQYLACHIRHGAQEKLRVLEIGAGTGGVTRFVLDRLGEQAEGIIFYYTDISSTFVRYGQRTFGAMHSCMQFERLNIEQDPVEQGFNLADFDLVYASNVLHDTKFLMNTLNQVGKLLRPEGLFILNEFTVMKDILLYTGGLLHGWWLFQDPENRLPNSCLLDVPRWKSVLEKAGFGNFSAHGLPFDETLDHCRQSVMFCTRNGTEEGIEYGISVDRKIEQAGMHVVPLEEELPLSSSSVKPTVIESIHPMVVEAIREIIGAKRFAQFDTAVPLMEQGIDSLEMVELNALFKRKAGIFLETTFLFQFNTAEKLSSYFKGKWKDNKNRLADTQADVEQNDGVENIGEVLALPKKKVSRGLVDEIESIISGLIGSKRMAQYESELPLMEIGIDSLELLELRTIISKKFGIALNAAFLFQYNTCDKVAAYLEMNGVALPNESCDERKTTQAVKDIDENAAQSDFHAEDLAGSIRSGDIAIVGIALRFPGNANDPEKFWDLLKTGTSAIRSLPLNRLDWPADVDVAGEKSYLTQGGFLDRIDEFDADFFRISPMEAELMDPQQRMLLELVWGASENAGYKPSGLAASETGIYIGACHFEYRSLLEQSGTSQRAFVATGSSGSILANRISYFYNFQGPSLVVDTACSSSLMAVHQAIRDLREGACRQAFVGGINLICNTVNVLAYDHAGMLSKDSKCATFDEAANGYVRGEGGAIIFLKRLQDAIDDKDHIYAVVKGSAVNHVGQSSSLTAPNPEAQGKLIIRAVEDSGLHGETISYIETHGTGTKLGDPIEVEGLNQAFTHFNGAMTLQSLGMCGIGSVKSNIGHLEGASGIAGLIKVALSLKNRMIPPTLNFKRLNPEIKLGKYFHIANRLKQWEVMLAADGKAIPRRAGVSAFGFGGANAHIVLQEYPQPSKRIDEDMLYLFTLSARNENSLLAMVKQYIAYLDCVEHDFSLTELSYTLQVAREEMDERLAIVFDSKEKLISRLVSVTEGVGDNAIYRGNRKTTLFSSLKVNEKNRDAESALQCRNLHELAELWTKGLSINWQVLYHGKSVRRVALPGYVFARDRYWVSKSNQVAVRNEGVRSLGEGLLGTIDVASSASQILTVLSGNESFLVDHVVNGRKVLPGVMYLEIARAAADAILGKKLPNTYLRLKNVVWSSPVFVDNSPVSIYTTIKTSENNKTSFEMITRLNGEGRREHLHGQGEIELFQLSQTPFVNIDSCLRSCTDNSVDVAEFYEAFQSVGIQYGISHKGVTDLRLGKNEVLAKLSLPLGGSHDCTAIFMHPGVLDSALQATFALDIAAAMPRLMLPFILDEVEIFSPCTNDMWAWIRCKEKGTSDDNFSCFDIDICDHLGAVCIKMKGYRSKMPTAAFGGKSIQSENLILTPVWDPVAEICESTIPSPSLRTVVIGARASEKKALFERFGKIQELHIQPGESIECMAEKIHALGSIEHIIWSVSTSAYLAMTDEALISEQEGAAIFGFRLIKALLLLGFGSRELKWTVVTTQACAIRRSEYLSPLQASIHGLIGAMAKEFIDWKVRLVDIEVDDHWPLDAIFRLPTDDEGNPWAFRRGRWYKQYLIPTQASNIDTEQYRHGGVYVVIGGAGGIGQVWSEFVAEHYQAKLIWIGRRPMDESIELKLNAVAKCGPRPLYISADARDRSELLRAYDEIKRHYSSINGVVHSAIVLRDQSLSNMTENQFHDVLSSKVDVCVRIAQVFQRESLDFALFFSSITAFTKVAGQGNYAAGCVFKDAFAHQLRKERNGHVKIMNWGYWGTVGIVATKERQENMARNGIGSIEPAEAMSALRVLLSSSIDQMAFLKLSDAAAS